MYGVNNYEACANEMTAIKATGLHHLSNVYNGTVYGDMMNWNSNEILNYGDMLLCNCLASMLNENPTYIGYCNVLSKSE